jgi:DNA-binding NtrC family response regulator
VNINNRTLEDIEKEVVLKAIEKTNDNKSEAADILGITTRTLRNKLISYGKEG